MEFKISKNANLFTASLLIGGGAIAAVGTTYQLVAHKEHFLQRLMANLLTDSFFFFAIGLGALFFLALQYATETGWYASVKKLIEAIAGWLPWGIAMLALTLGLITVFKGAHIYIWMDPAEVAKDEIIKNKSAFLNAPFFWIRTIVYFGTYIIFWRGFKRRSIQEDAEGGTALHILNYKKSAMFLVCFAVFSSTSAWDWLMSIDVHWFSTLFGWYIFAGMWCTTMICLVTLTLFLKKQGYLPNVNDSHIHDIAKWTFATSFLWSYLWFSQFMLIWYADFSEETIYFWMRIEYFKPLYFGMFVINFAFPMILLMSREAKRSVNAIIGVGAIIFFGHWIDIFQMVFIGSMGPTATLGAMEIGLFLVFLGVFVRVILTNLSKSPLTPVNHPFLDESFHHEI
jgi:hypothetical protein